MQIYLRAIAHPRTRRQFGAPSPAEIARAEDSFYEQHAPAKRWHVGAHVLAPLSLAVIVLGAALAAFAR
jgi:hypothetical protein